MGNVEWKIVRVSFGCEERNLKKKELRFHFEAVRSRRILAALLLFSVILCCVLTRARNFQPAPEAQESKQGELMSTGGALTCRVRRVCGTGCSWKLISAAADLRELVQGWVKFL
ncbi:hypothetical protein AV530_003961 [Patagioenas fasciata monilis]|uniref:Uncharacterized protein n=1 Tax=Patagioenas fasciata monilis TaxID=372326 RepID=A0A1V4K3H0_PATFA|nr:hypothetical protein AV530_003961 [Patagioenas fasciata monilis]